MMVQTVNEVCELRPNCAFLLLFWEVTLHEALSRTKAMWRICIQHMMVVI
jgi:hypothetical protein